MTIGVLALPGNFREHAAMLRRLGTSVVGVSVAGADRRSRRVRDPGRRVDGDHAVDAAPKLTDDTRVHERFLQLVREEQGVRA